MTKRPHPVEAHEAWVQSKPDCYRVAAFRGTGVWAKGEKPTFEQAVEIARSFYTNRPVSVYAVRGAHQSHIINITDKTEITMTYLVLWIGNYDRPVVAPFVDAEAAKKALDSVDDPGVTGAVVGGEADLSRSNGFTGASLVELHNRLLDAVSTADEPAADRYVSRFATLGDGARRVFALIEQLAKGKPVMSAEAAPPADPSSPASTPREGETPVATTSTAKKQKQQKKATKTSRGATSQPAGKVADLKTFRKGSFRANLLTAMDGKKTAEQIADALKCETGLVTSYTKFFSKSCAIGVDVDERGRLTVVFPGQKTLADVITEKKD